jgi:hypothetical protein
MAIGGSLLIVISALWEYARMNPDYRFIVEPWSLRGYETTQGRVVVAIGIGLLLLSVATLRENASLTFAATAAGIAWLAAIFIADLADPDPVDLELAVPVAIALTAVGSWIVVASGFALAGDRIPTSRRSLIRAGAWIVITLIVYLVLVAPNIVGSSSTMEVPVLIAIAYGIALLGAVAGRPQELSTVRVLLVSVVGGWIYITTMAGSVRSSLVTEQMAETGIAASYKDTQITSGIMIAFIGSLIVFAGAASIWAERRDRLTVLARAKRQHEAALESAAELESAV